MRASDEDRQQIVDLLRTALDDGRLKMDEYVERMGKALEASTYGELAVLHDDLPKSGTVAQRSDMGAPDRTRQQASQSPASSGGTFHSLPTALKVLWTIWLAAVSINVVVWVLVGVTTASFPYPWPLWVAGPSGAALFGVSAGVRSIQRSKPTKRVAQPRLDQGPGPGGQIGGS